MLKGILLALLSTIVLGTHVVVAQQEIPELSVLLPEATNPELLLRIKNNAPTAKMFCVRSNSLQANGRGYGSSIPHRCLSRANFSVVLPGESHVVPAADISLQYGSGGMSVTVAVVVAELGDDTMRSQEQRIHWEGNTEEARAAYRAISRR